jgi:hypothetical protein
LSPGEAVHRLGIPDTERTVARRFNPEAVVDVEPSRMLVHLLRQEGGAGDEAKGGVAV